MTPAMVHYGQAGEARAMRQKVLNAAHTAHPERFVNKTPTPPRQPEKVWMKDLGYVK